tara:strand:- start:299 stop:733 length:435 start_codon:yes stop_codon:yes gene_type:complete
MVKSKKAIGYYISKGRCLKAYIKYDAKKKKYSKKRYNSKNEELKKVKVYKKKSDCKKKIMKLKKTKDKGKKEKKQKKVKNQKRNKFGNVNNEMCTNYAPYFGSLVPVVSPYISGTPETGFSSVSAHWPDGLAKKLQSQSYRQFK